MNLESAVYLGVAGLVMAAASFMLGRRTGASVSRQLELEAELTTAHSEQARSEAEAERLRNELDAGRQEYDEYRLSVVDHFSGTSDLLRDLTGQYRAVYEHLTKGASTLCPEGFVGLTEGLPPPQLAEPQPDLEGVEATHPHEAASSESDRDFSAAHGTELTGLSATHELSEADDGPAPESPRDSDGDSESDPEATLGVPAVSG